MSSSSPKIVIHWLEHSRAQRVVWLLEELGLPYEVKHYKRDPKTLLAPDELREVHPLGKSPVAVITDNGQTITVAESGAIVEFLIERYGSEQLSVPASSSDLGARADYLLWLHWAEGSGMFPLLLSMIFAQMPKQAPWLARPLVSAVASGVMSQFVLPRLKSNFAFIEQSLEGKEFFAGGKLTGADIMMSFVAEGLEVAPVPSSKYPNITRWHAAVKERAAYKKAETTGGQNNLSVFMQ
ncbi:bifunctional glutathione transferase/peroxidase [Rhodotorula paludigena]|uniref:bifunctional glutathione transferase/peroxidase n=1 Tax=Rhodotorula paludigena TaxID=86838 RepID=UPI003174BA23